MVSYQKYVKICAAFRKRQGMKLFVLPREKLGQRFTPTAASKLAAELPCCALYICRPLMMLTSHLRAKYL